MTAPINQAEAITNLQRYLRRIGFKNSGGNTVPIDGIFDSATREALMDFQRSAGLSPTGIADKETWDALFRQYSAVTQDQRERSGLYIFPDAPKGYRVSAGDTLTLVRIIQLLLLELRATYDIFEDVSESGTFDARTQQAIRDFQEINGLSPTGEVDEATWNRIVREYANLQKRE